MDFINFLDDINKECSKTETYLYNLIDDQSTKVKTKNEKRL